MGQTDIFQGRPDFENKCVLWVLLTSVKFAIFALQNYTRIPKLLQSSLSFPQIFLVLKNKVLKVNCSNLKYFFTIKTFFRWQFLITYIFSVSMGRIHSNACYFKYTNTSLSFFFCLFFIKKRLFLSFSFPFLMNYGISATEY